MDGCFFFGLIGDFLTSKDHRYIYVIIQDRNNIFFYNMESTEFIIQRPNSPALISGLKCVIIRPFFVFHSNSMKLGEVLVHIDNYNFTEFLLNSNKKQKSFFNDIFNGRSVC